VTQKDNEINGDKRDATLCPDRVTQKDNG